YWKIIQQAPRLSGWGFRNRFRSVFRSVPYLGVVSGPFGPAPSPLCWKSRCCAGLFGSTCPCVGLAPSFLSSCDAVWPALAGAVGVLTCGVVGILVCDWAGALSALAAGFAWSEPLLHPAAEASAASAAARTMICRRITYSPLWMA